MAFELKLTWREGRSRMKRSREEGKEVKGYGYGIKGKEMESNGGLVEAEKSVGEPQRKNRQTTLAEGRDK